MTLMAFWETGFDEFLFGVLMRICSLQILFSVPKRANTSDLCLHWPEEETILALDCLHREIGLLSNEHTVGATLASTCKQRVASIMRQNYADGYFYWGKSWLQLPTAEMEK